MTLMVVEIICLILIMKCKCFFNESLQIVAFGLGCLF